MYSEKAERVFFTWLALLLTSVFGAPTPNISLVNISDSMMSTVATGSSWFITVEIKSSYSFVDPKAIEFLFVKKVLGVFTVLQGSFEIGEQNDSVSFNCWVNDSNGHILSTKVSGCNVSGNFSSGQKSFFITMTIKDISPTWSGKQLSVRSYVEKVESYNITLPKVEDCPDNLMTQSGVTEGYLSVSYPDKRLFRRNTNYSCLRSSTMYVDSVRYFGPVYIRSCGRNANWTGHGNIFCYKEPSVKLIKRDFIHGVDVNISSVCDVIDGFPIPSTTLDVKDKTDIVVFESTDKFIVNATYNGLTAVCNSSNKYDDAKVSNFSTSSGNISVLFGPYELNITSSCTKSSAQGTVNTTLDITFSANPPKGSLNITGFNEAEIPCEDRAVHCCGVPQKHCSVNLSNITPSDVINIAFHQAGKTDPYPVATNFNLVAKCKEDVEGTTFVTATTESGTGNTGGVANTAIIAAAAIGGGLVLLVLVYGISRVIVKQQQKIKDSLDTKAQNPCFAESSLTNAEDGSEREICQNVLYDTTDNLKPGSSNDSAEVVDNILYGTTAGDSQPSKKKVRKKGKQSDANQSADIYSTVDKPNKNKAKSKFGENDPSTSGLQTDGAYAVLNKKKKGKDAGKNSGKENAGFSGDVQEETYAVVNKKKEKTGKGKNAERPSTSAPIEEATYAVVEKKVKKKPKKDDSDDEDLHGSNI